MPPTRFTQSIPEMKWGCITAGASHSAVVLRATFPTRSERTYLCRRMEEVASSIYYADGGRVTWTPMDNSKYTQIQSDFQVATGTRTNRNGLLYIL